MWYTSVISNSNNGKSHLINIALINCGESLGFVTLARFRERISAIYFRFKALKQCTS